MIYCKRCVYPANHPLNIVFDDNGVCSGCRVHEEKDRLDWQEREEKLKSILDSFRNKSGRSYDCIIPVSGGKDSYFIVDQIRHKFKMTPLLVSYNRQYNTRIGLRNFAYLKSKFNCDLVEMVVDPQKVKKITRYTLKKLGSMHWHTLAGHTVFPVQIAVRFKIPLIIWGAHQGLEQVGMFSHLDEVEMTRKYRKEHDLMNCEAEDLVNLKEDVTEKDALPFIYPHDREIEKTGVRGIYLSNYIRWDSKTQHEKMIASFNYETNYQQRTYDTYNDIHCQHYSGIHDYIKYVKWGYGKVSDHVCRDIRLKRLTREEGIDLVASYQDIIPNDLDKLLNWLSISTSEFYDSINHFRDPSIWHKPINGDWILKDSIINHYDDTGINTVRLSKKANNNFKITNSKVKDQVDDSYVLLHKGFVHPNK